MSRQYVERLRRAVRQIGVLPVCFRLIWASSRAWSITWAICLLVQGLLPIVVVYQTRYFVDALSRHLTTGNRSLLDSGVVVPSIVLAGAILLAELLRITIRFTGQQQAELLQDHISSLIHDRAVNIDICYFDNSDFHDELYRARYEAAHRPVQLLENVGGLLQSGITLVSMAMILVPLGWWIPIALFASTMPAFWVVLRFAVLKYHWKQRTTASERRTWYYDWVLVGRESAAELRLFNLADHFRELYVSLRTFLRLEKRRLHISESMAEMAAILSSMLITGLTFGWVILGTVRGDVTLGNLAYFYQAFSQGQRMMRSILQQTGQLFANSFFLQNLLSFLELEAQIVSPRDPKSPANPLSEAIVLDGVRFSYSTSNRDVLSNFNMTIPANRMTALLGSNGAGKSTLIKLICRFYDPSDGSVRWDGVDLKDLDLDELRRNITVLFQEPVRYNITAKKNISLGDVQRMHQTDRVVQSAVSAGADIPISRLANGYDQLLGNWFESGTELSTGEWQRIALARAFFRAAPLLILDEPTSAMDPWAEADWLRRMKELAVGRTVLIITHRLSTARVADLIYVAHEGSIREYGTHDQLVQRGGRYAESWTNQLSHFN